MDGIDWNKVTGYADINREGVLWEIYPARYDSVAYKTLPEPIAEGEETYSGKYPISAVSPCPFTFSHKRGFSFSGLQGALLSSAAAHCTKHRGSCQS